MFRLNNRLRQIESHTYGNQVKFRLSVNEPPATVRNFK